MPKGLENISSNLLYSKSMLLAGKIFSPDDKRFRKGRKALSKKQAELYESVYDRGDSVGEYATDNKIDQSTASKRNSAVIKKFKKIFG